MEKFYERILQSPVGTEVRPFIPAFAAGTSTTVSSPFPLHHNAEIASTAYDIGLGAKAILTALFLRFPKEARNPLPEETKNILQAAESLSLLPMMRLESNAADFLNLIFSVTGNVEAILVRLADIAVQMEHLDDVPADHRQQTAAQCRMLYTPLAHKLGLYHIKTRMEENLLLYDKPAVYRQIEADIRAAMESSSDYIARFIEPLRGELDNMGMQYTIKSRTKSVSSVYAKMQSKKVDFSEVYDLFAIRIITQSPTEMEMLDCWRAYSIVTGYYKPELARMRDWITVPKPGGYESLHVTVEGPGKKWVEVQIRTQRMDDDAESGRAAHWKYKGNRGNNSDEWLKTIRTALEKNETPEIPRGSKEERIYVFTPNGDIKSMAKASTVLDFAFKLHTGMALQCSGGRINGKIVPIKHELKSGDKVEILTSKNQSPNLDWLKWATNTAARNRIKKALREAEFSQAEIGKEIFRRKLTQLKFDNIEEALAILLPAFRLTSTLQLYQLLAEGKIEAGKLKEVLQQGRAQPKPPEETLPIKPVTHHTWTKTAILINEHAEMEGYKLAKCCNPVMGDEIFGFVTINEGIKIHRTNCPNAPRLMERYPYRVMSAQWMKSDPNTYFVANVKVSGFDQLGLLSSITHLINQELRINIRNINMTSKQGKFEGVIQVSVKDNGSLEFLLKKLLTIKGITRSQRLNT